MRLTVFILLFSVALSGQAEAPKLSELDALKIQNIELRLTLLQFEMTKLQEEATRLVQSLQKPGFTLERGTDGQWRYTAVQEKK